MEFRSYKRLLAEYPYLKQLSIDEKAWLVQFSKEYDSGYFQKGKEHIHTPELKTKVSRKRDSYRRDVMNKCDLIPYEEESETDKE